MSEYIDLIQKEKEAALRDYSEDTFRLQLDRKTTEETKPSRSYVTWLQKPAIAGSTVLLILFFGWLSTQVFLPSSQESDVMLLKNTFVQVFNLHDNILDRSAFPVEMEAEKSAIHEFEWSLKRVIFAIQRENVQDEDIAQNLSRVLQNAAVFFKAEKNKSGELNI
ncbi:MAG: hypothetical protein JSV17_10395 [Candidatus Aminicenantes bacterium]|nr:MAG: hypothetical protein JSV17_10395 [Candidatus Aminicenantes bacterium]